MKYTVIKYISICAFAIVSFVVCILLVSCSERTTFTINQDAMICLGGYSANGKYMLERTGCFKSVTNENKCVTIETLSEDKTVSINKLESLMYSKYSELKSVYTMVKKLGHEDKFDALNMYVDVEEFMDLAAIDTYYKDLNSGLTACGFYMIANQVMLNETEDWDAYINIYDDKTGKLIYSYNIKEITYNSPVNFDGAVRSIYKESSDE